MNSKFLINVFNTVIILNVELLGLIKYEIDKTSVCEGGGGCLDWINCVIKLSLTINFWEFEKSKLIRESTLGRSLKKWYKHMNIYREWEFVCIHFYCHMVERFHLQLDWSSIKKPHEHNQKVWCATQTRYITNIFCLKLNVMIYSKISRMSWWR